MATFTMTLRDALRADRVDDVDLSIIGLDSYPIWDESLRDVLNDVIVRRYWLREIGHATVEMFRFRMESTMLEIMPYYNKLGETLQFQYDPFETINLKNISSLTGSVLSSDVQSSNSTASGTNNGENVSMTADYPQSQLREQESYASSGNESKAKSESANTSDSRGESINDTETEQSSENTSVGSQGNKTAMLLQYRDAILDIPPMVANDLNPLFMSLMNNDSSYAPYDYFGHPHLF